MDNIIEELKLVSDLKTLERLNKKPSNLQYLGVKKGEIKKIYTRNKVKKNQGLVLQLLNSDIYELLIIGLSCIDNKIIDKQVLINLSNRITNEHIKYDYIPYVLCEYVTIEECLTNITEDNIFWINTLIGYLYINDHVTVSDYTKIITYIQEQLNRPTLDSNVGSKLDWLTFTLATQLVQFKNETELFISSNYNTLSQYSSKDILQRIQKVYDANRAGIIRKSARCN